MTTANDERRTIYRPKPRPLDVVVTGGEILAQITIYDELTLLTRKQGGRWAQYPITLDAIADVLSGVQTVSGLLPQHTLGTGRVNGQPFYVLYVPPTVRTLRMEVGSYTVPLPPLVWAGCGTDYRIWALGEHGYPTSTSAPLMVAPFPNCYKDGRVCWGTADGRPAAAPGTLPHVLKLFLEESYFNLHLANGKSVQYTTSVVARWQQLVDGGALEYPLDDLMPAECQLTWALSGQAWGGGR
jgi:hypothetical protein